MDDSNGLIKQRYTDLDKPGEKFMRNIAAKLIVTEFVKTQGGNCFDTDQTFNVYIL